MTASTIVQIVWILTVYSILNFATCLMDLDFRLTPPVVIPLESKNVTIKCSAIKKGVFRPDGNPGLLGLYVRKPPTSSSEKNSIAMIRILKNFQSKWQVIAQISNVAPNVAHKIDPGVNNTDGFISDDEERLSFLQATWNVATLDCFGTFRCDVINFDSNQNAILTTSSDLVLGSTLNAQDMLRLLKHDMTDIRRDIDQNQRSDHDLLQILNTTLQKMEEQTAEKVKYVETQVTEQRNLLNLQIEKLENKTDDLIGEIFKKLEEVSSKVNLVLASGFLMIWPRGSYGLLEPESGCSDGGMTKWESGRMKHHTESTNRNRDDLSNEIHLKQPILQRVGGKNFVTQHFCIKMDAYSVGPDWPRGSYCINKKGNCPNLFTEGFITWDEENDNRYQTYGGSLPDIISNENVTKIKYCCRKDGQTNVPIYLPNSHPFYLYRYGGRCQQVHDMSVTEEFIVFDTENTNNLDEFSNVHPDGTISNIRLELCFYTKM